MKTTYTALVIGSAFDWSHDPISQHFAKGAKKVIVKHTLSNGDMIKYHLHNNHYYWAVNKLGETKYDEVMTVSQQPVNRYRHVSSLLNEFGHDYELKAIEPSMLERALMNSYIE